MTSNTVDKARGILLAALMVTSVFAGAVAFTGAAAAQEVSSADRTLSSTEAQPGETVEVTIDASLDSSGGVQINDQFTSDLDATITSGLGSLDNAQDDQVTFNAPTGTQSQYTVTYEVTVPQDATVGTTYSFSGAVQGSNQASISGDSTITVVGDSDDGNNQNGPSDEIVNVKGEDYDEAASSNSIRWQGQELLFKDASAAGETYELRELNDDDEVSNFVSELSLDENGEVTINTENLEGQYVITDGRNTVVETSADGTVAQKLNAGPSNNVDASFEVTVQTLTAAFDDNEVPQETEFLELTSNRGEYVVEVTADGLSQEDVEDLFDAASNDDLSSVDVGEDQSEDDEDITELTVTSQDANISVDFTDVDTGSYTFDFDVDDTSATATDSIEVTDEEDEDASFVRSSVRTAQGDYAIVPIQLEQTDTARLYIGYNDVGFNMTVDVEDGDDDDQVVLEINTYALGRQLAEDDGYSATAANSTNGVATTSITTRDDSDIVNQVVVNDPSSGLSDAPLAPTAYEMNITSTTNPTDNEYAVGTLQITQPRVNELVGWTAPGEDFDEIEQDEPTETWELLNDGRITQQSSVAQGDVIVWQISSTSMIGALEAADLFTDGSDNDNYADAFVALMDESDPATNPTVSGQGTGTAGDAYGEHDTAEDFEFRMTQTDSSANFDPYEVDLAATNDNNGLKVVPDQRNGSVFVVMNEEDVKVDRQEFDYDDFDGVGSSPANTEGDATTDLNDGQEYQGNFTIYDESNIVDDTTSLTDGMDIVEKQINFDTGSGDVIRLQAAAGQEVTGTTTVAPGTELNIRLRGTGTNAFLEDPDAIVQSDRTFSATVDLSDRASNTTFEASARGFDDDYDTQGVIGDAATADVTFSDQTLENGEVTVDSVTMSSGGFVAIHQGSASGPVIGNSSYLQPGTSEDVTITLNSDLASTQTLVAMPHQDTNDNQAYEFPDADAPYTANGSAVVDSATVTVQTQTDTPDTDTPDTDTPDTDMPDTDTPDTDTDEPDTEEPSTATEAGGSGTEAGEETTTGGGGPGFTAGLALVALLGAALLAARRQN